VKYRKSDCTRVCEICDEHIGRGYDHTECSKIKKELYGSSLEAKNPKKKLSKKALDAAAIYFRDSDE
jgi:hypothetical protein